MRLAVVGEGTVDGYARYELSEEGDNATMAASPMSQVYRELALSDHVPSGLGVVSMT